MNFLKKIVDRIGLTILNPQESFDLLVVEGVPLKEGITVTIFSLLMLSLSATVSSNNLANPILSFIGSLAVMSIFWILFTVSFSSVIRVLYKVPGNFKDFFSGISYTLSTSILPAVMSVILVAFSPSFSIVFIAIYAITSLLWFIWTFVLIYMFTKSYFKVDFAQFFAALVVSLIVIGVVIAALAIFAASILFVWWVF